ncbi:similar to Saccharomyces cerevisiae YML079W Non-essential protein of unknown function with structural resemblance to plant storage and ligand binding proteins [Maudiozyma saulgeensis]|uniref:DUF985 domain-containing protein n=1 Tax=Maudiozyma saulgeensis TaxID=1789683 RepID=A0A1X7RA86_9SACH|nr:similar to Saccharomyces cerevisiae YML079W Non-essential protein of unknown function with structural resemblance to plant storage and ligand binding proteins [Kazachstania saulgeensis]
MSKSFGSASINDAPNVPIEAPQFVVSPNANEPAAIHTNLIKDWQMIKHREGGYFKETDRSPFTMTVGEQSMAVDRSKDSQTENTVIRNYSTLIYYLLTTDSPVGKLHKNKNRIIHILQRGKGQYVLIHPDGTIKSFRVGFDYANGEVSQWVVPGGVYKASFLLPNEEFSDGLLISEVVVPGFDFDDHMFMPNYETLVQLVGDTQTAQKLKFLL